MTSHISKPNDLVSVDYASSPQSPFSLAIGRTDLTGGVIIYRALRDVEDANPGGSTKDIFGLA